MSPAQVARASERDTPPSLVLFPFVSRPDTTTPTTRAAAAAAEPETIALEVEIPCRIMTSMLATVVDTVLTAVTTCRGVLCVVRRDCPAEEYDILEPYICLT